MSELRVMSASVDVLGGDVTARPAAQEQLEQCRCPPEYSGASCQSCASGHYRDYTTYKCLTCPCNGHEDACQQDVIQEEVVCTCNQGWVGQFCDTRQENVLCSTDFARNLKEAHLNRHLLFHSPSRPIDVRIRGPLVQTVRPGETVRFDCGAKPKIKIQVTNTNMTWTYNT